MHPEPEQRQAVTLLWALTGVVAEGGAGLALLYPNPWGALALHVTASAAFGLLAVDGKVVTRRASLFVAFLLVLTLPVLGALGVSSVLAPAWRARVPAEVDDVLEIEMPEFEASTLASAPVPIEVVLRNGDAAHERVASVMALRRMDAQLAVPLLRVALSDPHEDVRLLAYAILERREKDLRGRIDAALAELEGMQANVELQDAAPRASVLRALAEHHWELVNGGFVSGEIDTQAMDAAVRHGHASLLLVPDGSLAVLLARIRLRGGEATDALRYLRVANALGVATEVLAPLYAEVAFLLRRFDAIGPLLAHAGDVARPRLDDVVLFWSRGRDT